MEKRDNSSLSEARGEPRGEVHNKSVGIFSHFAAVTPELAAEAFGQLFDTFLNLF